MKEIYDLRVRDEFAYLAGLQGYGNLIGPSTRRVTISNKDAGIGLVRDVTAQLRLQGKFLFLGWSITRKYSKAEIVNAKLFWLKPKSFFEPEGEYCGTVYDESKACPKCGAGAEQISALHLPISRIPKSKDFSQTIAGEMVVSQRFVDLFNSFNFAGATFTPLESKGRSATQKTNWYQIKIDSAQADIVPPTITGLALFEQDEKGEHICPNGDLIGLNPLSEFTVSLFNENTSDIFRAQQFLGNRRGVLRPWQPIFVSPRLRKLIVDEKLKGLNFEVAYVRE
jgi:hypothetical protein